MTVFSDTQDRVFLQHRLQGQGEHLLECYRRTIGDPYEWPLYKRFSLNATIRPNGSLSLERDQTAEAIEEQERKPEGYRENQECLQAVMGEVTFPPRKAPTDIRIDVEY